MRDGACLANEPKPLDNAVIEVDDFAVVQAVNISRHGHSRPIRKRTQRSIAPPVADARADGIDQAPRNALAAGQYR